MIIKHDEIDYSGVVSNVIEHIKTKSIWVMNIWTDGAEIPFTATDNDVVEFLEESVKITKGQESTWILYGIIMTFKVTGK